MAIATGTSIPGYARPAQVRPGFQQPFTPPAPPASGILVGDEPVLLGSSAPAGDTFIPSGTCYITNGSTAIYLGGGANLTTSNGLLLAANASTAVPVFPGDTLYAVTASGTSTVHVTQTGS